MNVKKDWQGRWINPELAHDAQTKEPASYLRRTFTVREVKDATLAITCHGLYVAWINGKRVGNFVLAPGSDNYKARLQVLEYDVTDLLVPGENEILVCLGDGWYRGHNGIDGHFNLHGTDIALLCQLEVGGEIVLVSDDRWEASQEGPVRENDMELGEFYDARREGISMWHGVKEEDFGFDQLVPTESVPVTEHEHFEGKVFTAPNGETVVDFGQNLSGYTTFALQAKAGQMITIWHGETLDENGNFTQKNYDPGARNKFGGIPQKITYICKEGENVYTPSFVSFGFRYAKVETDVDLTDAKFTSVAVYSDMAEVGAFSCGNADVNQLFRNAVWSMKSNYCDVPTDCPTRERAGWTGDAGAFTPTAVYLMDCYPVMRKWLANCRISQNKDGIVANISPINTKDSPVTKMLNGSAGWADAAILVPWALYQAYGKKEILEENYDMMKRWLAFCEKRAKKSRITNVTKRDPHQKFIIDTGFHWGEWLEPDIPSGDALRQIMTKGAPEVATAYFFRSASLLGRIAEILGHYEDAKKYEDLAENIKAAYRNLFVKDGRIHSDRQCEYVRPLAFGLLEKDEERQAADDLAELVKKNGYHLNTGFLSTPDLCRVLAENGHADVAYKLLLQDTCPGWLYAVKKGATTIWETWDGIREDGTIHDSFNHYSYGAIVGWLFNGVCGIKLSAGELRIAPCPSEELGHAKAVWQSPVGEIVSSWKYEEEELVYEITVPVAARIEIPGQEFCEVEAGTYHWVVER